MIRLLIELFLWGGRRWDSFRFLLGFQENDRRLERIQQNDPAFDGKIRRKLYGNTFSSCFLDAFDRKWRFEWKKHNWYIMNHNPANMIIIGGF